MTQLPVSYESEQEIALARRNYENALNTLDASLSHLSSGVLDEAVAAVGSIQPFYLASQGHNDRELQAKYGKMISRILALKYPQWSEPLSLKPLQPGEKIKVGFVSGFFREHANWKILLKGFANSLDRSRFQLLAYYTSGIKDDITAEASKTYDVFFQSENFEELCKRIREDDLQVLIFPETGMDPLAFRLAALRLAPVQCVSWGHPDTSGLPTIDYYLSSELMEPENAQDFYTEKLILLPNLSICYLPRNQTPETSRVNSYELEKGGVNYLCLQGLHKYLPQHDHIYPRIAARVPGARFVFVANPAGAESVLEQRLKDSFAAAGMNSQDHIVFLPVLSNPEYCALCRIGDVFLDSIEWSGCTTTLEAIEQNCVPITLPGTYMRGRHTSAILTMMNMTELIANSIDDYVELAIRLGLDESWRAELKTKVENNKTLVYNDQQATEALSDFLSSLCKTH